MMRSKSTAELVSTLHWFPRLPHIPGRSPDQRLVKLPRSTCQSSRSVSVIHAWPQDRRALSPVLGEADRRSPADSRLPLFAGASRTAGASYCRLVDRQAHIPAAAIKPDHAPVSGPVWRGPTSCGTLRALRYLLKVSIGVRPACADDCPTGARIRYRRKWGQSRFSRSMLRSPHP